MAIGGHVWILILHRVEYSWQVGLQVVDVSRGEAVAPLQVGELLLRAPSVMAGYFLDRAATREVLDQNGWLRTGDLAYYDRNGFVFVVDRLKDVMLYTRGHFKHLAEDE